MRGVNMVLSVLEWTAFAGVLLSTWLYGSSGRSGPIVGAFAAAAFIVYGFMYGDRRTRAVRQYMAAA